jgi:ubiquinone/menaquinone biosynthesis C-methylase UbiE
MPENRNFVAQFGAAAEHWDKYRKFIRLMYKPVTDALVEDARIERGHAVLDVATGPGEPALSIIDLIGPTGEIIGVDAAPAMIEVAKREAGRMRLANARFEVAPADKLPFDAQTFDSVICRFGAMFFPSPLESLREVLRVLKPAGRIALAVWSLLDRNPFQYVVSDVVGKHIPLRDDDALRAFRFSEQEKLLAILNEAGGFDSSERLISFEIQVTLPPEHFWDMRSHMSLPLLKALERAEPAQVEIIKHEVLEALQPYSGNDQISIPAEVLIVSCSKTNRR